MEGRIIVWNKMNGIDNQRHIVLNLRAQLFHTAVNSKNNKKKNILKCLLILAGNFCIKHYGCPKGPEPPVQCAVGLEGTVPVSVRGWGVEGSTWALQLHWSPWQPIVWPPSTPPQSMTGRKKAGLPPAIVRAQHSGRYISCALHHK